MLKLIIQAALVEGVFTEKVNSREGQTTFAKTALHHLKDFGTSGVSGEREREREREYY